MFSRSLLSTAKNGTRNHSIITRMSTIVFTNLRYSYWQEKIPLFWNVIHHNSVIKASKVTSCTLFTPIPGCNTLATPSPGVQSITLHCTNTRCSVHNTLATTAPAVQFITFQMHQHQVFSSNYSYTVARCSVHNTSVKP